MTDKDEALSRIDAELAAAGHPCVRESFRMPAWQWISPAVGFGLAAGSGFALAAGRPGLGFFAGAAGAAILLLDACGFAPLDWIGPKFRRRILVVPGAPSGAARKAVFIGIPLDCLPQEVSAGGRAENRRRISYLLGIAVAGTLAVLSGAWALLLLPPLAPAGPAAGAALVLSLAVSGTRAQAHGRRRNRAADWVIGLATAQEGRWRPFLFVYPGDPGEAKFFLARYRGPLFRGCGIFLEFPEGARGPAGVSRAEGPLVPYRVDPALLAEIRAAGEAAGTPVHSIRTIRRKTAALYAMARGFRAATLHRAVDPIPGMASPDDNAMVRWILEMAKARGNTNGLTGDGEGV